MKKVFFALAVLRAIAITATGCKSKSTPKTADSVAVEEADTLVTDSFSYHSEQDSTVYSTLRIDYPRGEGSLPMAVRKFIAHELSQLSPPPPVQKRATRRLPTIAAVWTRHSNSSTSMANATWISW